jgi:hypothetical protein
MVPVPLRILRILLFIAGIALFISGPVLAFTANSLDITVDESGDAIAIFRFSLEGMLENAIPQSILEEELLKGLSTSSEPPELITMDRSSATIRMKQFASVADVPTGTEYRTVTMNFKKAEIALQSSALSSVVTADFTPSTITITFPDSYNRQFMDADVLPSITHIVIDPVKAAAAAASAVQTQPTGGAIKALSSPEGITVSIDGNYVGTAPSTFSDIPAGQHTLTFAKENYEPVSKEVTVTEGQTIQVTVFLSPVPPTPQAPGFAGILAGIALALCVFVRIRK